MSSAIQMRPLGELVAPGEAITYGVVKPGDDPPDGVLFVRGGDIKSGRVETAALRRITEDVSRQYRRTLLRGGELLVSLVGNPGEVAIAPPSLAGANIARQVGLVRLAPTVSAEFIKYYLMSRPGRLALGAQSLGSVQTVINLSDLKRVPIPEISLPSQRAIASVLTMLDDKIELNRRMNETLEAMAQAIFRDWFVDFGPVRRKLTGATDPIQIMGGVTTDPARAAELAAIFPAELASGSPEGWGQASVYDIASVQYGAPFASDRFNSVRLGRPLVRIRDLPSHGSDIFTDEVHAKEHVIRAGDIVVGMDGEFRAYLWQGPDSLMNQRVCSFIPRQSHLRAFTWFSIKPLLASMEQSAVGTTVIHLGKKDIDRFEVLDPGARVVAEFGALVEPLLDRLVLSGSENRTLAETRDYLLPRLMSGEVKVGEVAQGIAA